MVDRLTGKKVIGIKQAQKTLKNGQGKIVYIASDAEERLMHPIKQMASDAGLKIIYVDTMKELGKLCGIDVGASVVVLLND